MTLVALAHTPDLTIALGPALNWYRCLPLDYAFQQQNLPEGLPTITVPVLAVGSELDFIAAYEFYELLENYCSDWEQALIPDAGHWTQQENPAALNEVLVSWLRRRF